MIQYYFLNKLLQQVKPASITVDVFDTILLRKWQPEAWRFFVLAKAMSQEINKTGLKSSTYQIYSARQNLSKLLRSANLEAGKDHETTHTAIVKAIILELSRQQKLKLTKGRQTKLVAKLKSIELRYEITQLRPNKSLIKILKSAKNTNCKLYFVSDMYLETRELKKLLTAHGVKFFDGGISSADNLLGKSSGRSFLELVGKYPAVSLLKSIHIGDNKQTDFRVPKQIGLKAFYLYLPLHRLYLWSGKIVFTIFLRSKTFQIHRRQKKQLTKKIKQQFGSAQMSTEQEAIFIGWLFGPAIIHYLTRLGVSAEIQSRPVVFVSSESHLLSRFYKQLGFTNPKILPHFNRSRLLRAYCAVLSSKGLALHSIVPIAKKVLRRKNTRNALAVLNITSQGSNQYNLVGPKGLTEAALNKLDIKKNIGQWKADLKYVLSKWNTLASKETPIISDVGWNDTIQILLGEVLRESSKESNLTGIYLARTGTNIFHSDSLSTSSGIIFNSLKESSAKYLYQPEVWESFLNSDNVANPTRENIVKGIDQSIDYYMSSGVSSENLWRYSKPTLLRALKRPPRRIIEVMASMQFDYGTSDEPICRLVNTTVRPLQAWKWLLLDRRKFKKFYFHQGWKWGAASYYHFRIAYRLWRLKSRKSSF